MANLINIIDISTSVMRAVNKAITTISNFNLTEMPTVKREEIESLVIMGTENTFISIVTFEIPGQVFLKAS